MDNITFSLLLENVGTDIRWISRTVVKKTEKHETDHASEMIEATYKN